jgi:hypothetical protein
VHSGSSERLPERLRCGRLAVAGKGEAVLGTIGTDDLARDHLEVPLLLSVPAAHIAAIQPNHGEAGRLCHRMLRRPDKVLSHDCRADPQRSVPDRAGVLPPPIGSSSDRKAATLPKGTSAAYRAVT